MMTSDLLKPTRRTLIGHGALLIFTGGIIGFGFLFFIVGEISLWPIPGRIEYQLPGTTDAWRMAHMEAIVNGAVMWILAACLQYFPFGPVGNRRIAWGMIIAAWTFVIGSLFDPFFPESKGLIVSDRFTNNLSFAIFYPGVALIMIMMPIIAFKSFFGNSDED